MLVGDHGVRHSPGSRQDIDVKGVGAAPGQLLHLIRNLIQSGQRFAKHAVKRAAIIRQHDVAAARGDQRNAKFIFQPVDLFGDRGLRDVHAFRGPGDVLKLGDGGEIAKLG